MPQAIRLVDNNYNAVGSRVAEKAVTFTATGNGAVGTVTLFTVTGVVKLKVISVCNTTTTIQAGATLEVGIAGATTAFIAQTAGDAPDQNEIWHDTTPDTAHELSSVGVERYLGNGQDIILTVATNTIDSGVITFYAIWEPISSGSSVVAA